MGLDLRRWSPEAGFDARRSGMIQKAGVDLVIDVGANEGQYVRGLRAGGYTGLVISVEPLASAFAALSNVSSRDPHWKVIRAAAGSSESRMELHVAGNSVSSSLLPMLDRHVRAEPTSTAVGLESVEVSPLDLLVEADLAESSAALLKIDSQGFEDEVLKGATETLKGEAVVGLEVELSLVPLYEGQLLWGELSEVIRGFGFVPLSFSDGFRDPETGELLQVDGLFGRARRGHQKGHGPG